MKSRRAILLLSLTILAFWAVFCAAPAFAKRGIGPAELKLGPLPAGKSCSRSIILGDKKPDCLGDVPSVPGAQEVRYGIHRGGIDKKTYYGLMMFRQGSVIMARSVRT